MRAQLGNEQTSALDSATGGDGRDIKMMVRVRVMMMMMMMMMMMIRMIMPVTGS